MWESMLESIRELKQVQTIERTSQEDLSPTDLKEANTSLRESESPEEVDSDNKAALHLNALFNTEVNLSKSGDS